MDREKLIAELDDSIARARKARAERRQRALAAVPAFEADLPELKSVDLREPHPVLDDQLPLF